jgi:hypothetical protein
MRGSSGVAQTLELALSGLIARSLRRRIANHQHLTAFPTGARLPDCFISSNLTLSTGTICGAHICML